MMKKLTTHLTLIAVLALLTLTVSFAHWRAQAAHGPGIMAELSAKLLDRQPERKAAAAAPVKVAPAAPMFATITVDSTADGTLAALAGNGTCDLREAITAANTNAAVDACAAGVAGADVIEFSGLGAGTPTINVLSALPTITDPVTINGNTGGSTRVELNGTGIPGSNGLTILAGNSTITGLVINRFEGYGIRIGTNGGNTIKNCYIGTDANGMADLGNSNTGVRIDDAPTNTIGGTMTAERNVISGNNVHGIEIFGATATGNKVIGNYIGTDANGTADLGNSFEGVRIQNAPSNTIGGTNAAARNVISGNNRHGVFMFGATASGNTVIGNYLGTDVNGTADLGNTQDGVNFEGAPNNIVGGITAAERNVISGNNRMGVYIFRVGASGNQVLGNYLGTDVNGTADLGNGFDGVLIEDAPNNTVGGTTAAARNLISGNDRYGVRVFSVTATGNTILGNSIFNNSNLGIDLGPDGTVTANDAGDGDLGPNNLQNFPVLTCVTSAGGATTIGGTLNSLATTAFRIEYFVNDACDASGHGEGQTLLGTQNVTTDGSGNAPLNATFASAIAVGKFITATATRLDALSVPVETSEFSACLAVSAPPTLAISDVTLAEGNAGATNFVFTVTLSGAQTWCLPVTVNYATADGPAANGATAGSDYTATNGTLTFPAPHASNSVTRTITVPVMGDTVIEPTETFFINLSGATNVLIADNQGLGTITNDDNTLPPFRVEIGDPLLCLTAGGLVGVTATVTNNNAAAVNAVFTATLPTTLNGLPGTGLATINPGGVVVMASAVTWTGTVPANTTVTITYKTQLVANAPPNTPICVNSDVVFNGVVRATVQECKVLGCPTGPVNARVSDQKAGAVLAFPYYVSKAADRKDTRLTISNIGDANARVHLFFIDGNSCAQADQFLCLTPNASFSLKASEYDPEATGWLLAVAVDAQGLPVQYNGLVGNAFVNDGEYVGNYGAEAFRANSALLATTTNNSATLFFDQQSYDAVPNQFAMEIQSPLDAVGQRVVTIGLRGDLTTSAVSGAAQVGTGLVTNGSEKPFGSFSAWLLGNCQAQATLSATAPRVPNGMSNIIPSGQLGTVKWNIGGGVGLLLTPRTAAWRGIRTLHKTGLTATTLTIPVLAPVC